VYASFACLMSRDGGTGRRSGLKIRRASALGGSTPPPGTICSCRCAPNRYGSLLYPEDLCACCRPLAALAGLAAWAGISLGKFVLIAEAEANISSGLMASAGCFSWWELTSSPGYPILFKISERSISHETSKSACNCQNGAQ
jgi:hypothetical protein